MTATQTCAAQGNELTDYPLLVGPRTTWVSRTTSSVDAPARPNPMTMGGLPTETEKASHAGELAELRRRSGLTWEQIAEVMGVGPRTVYFWMAGRPMRPVHEAKFQRVLQIVRRVDRGSSEATRALLLDSSQGPMLIDLLAGGAFPEAMIRATGFPIPVARPRPEPLSEEARESRRPLPLAIQLHLEDASVERVDRGKARPAKTTKLPRK